MFATTLAATDTDQVPATRADDAAERREQIGRDLAGALAEPGW